ncbi:MAG: hypothetical protein GX625_11720 [Clostridiaceae bacterium]|jgi:hypothetical protein|nr:hypothetical protein [Clostridiaceae bacterium]
MIKIQIQSDSKDKAVDMVRSAISAEIKRLELGLDNTNQNINEFEKKYNIPSSLFLEKYSAEDMENQDNEYVEWAGELRIKDRILSDLNQLKDIEYVAQ